MDGSPERQEGGDGDPVPASSEHKTPASGAGGDDFTEASLIRALNLLLSSEVEDPLESLLALVGSEMGVSRAYLVCFRDEGRWMHSTHEWCAPGVQSLTEELESIPTELYGWGLERLATDEGIRVTAPEDLPPEAEAERELMAQQGIQAVRAFPLRRRSGELLGFMAFDQLDRTRDWSDRTSESLRIITAIATRELEREEILGQVRVMQERLMRTERIAQVGGWEFEPSTGSTWWSRQARDLLGMGADEPDPTLFDFFQRVHPDDRERARQTVLQVLDDGRAFRFECRLVPGGAGPGDRTVSHLEMQGQRLEDTGGEPARVVGTLQDMTLRRAMEDELGRSQRLEILGKLAGGVAHDFNSLLSVIQANTELLLATTAPDDPSRDDLEQIKHAALEGASLTGKLLASTRPKVRSEGPVEVSWVVRGVERVLSRLLPENLKLEVRSAPRVGVTTMDGTELEQVLMNLALNARDAMAKKGGRLTIGTEVQAFDEPLQVAPGQSINPGEYVVISVQDEGHGMTPEVQARAFEPFFTTRDEDMGRGLGLSFVFGEVQQAGGGIGLESRPGGGTTFRVFLPRTGDEPTPV